MNLFLCFALSEEYGKSDLVGVPGLEYERHPAVRLENGKPFTVLLRIVRTPAESTIALSVDGTETAKKPFQLQPGREWAGIPPIAFPAFKSMNSIFEIRRMRYRQLP